MPIKSDKEIEEEFEKVITDHKSWHTNLGVPNWDVIKKFLLSTLHQQSAMYEEKIKEEVIADGRVLRFCSRCGKEWCKMGKVVEWGKSYPAFIKKEKDGKTTDIPADREVVKALCRECAKETYDESDREKRWEEVEKVIKLARSLEINIGKWEHEIRKDDSFDEPLISQMRSERQNYNQGIEHAIETLLPKLKEIILK